MNAEYSMIVLRMSILVLISEVLILFYNCVKCFSVPVTDLCANNPCYNGGTCSQVNETVVCRCVFGTTGHFCETGNADLIHDTCHVASYKYTHMNTKNYKI